jgi:hypothetical protein
MLDKFYSEELYEMPAIKKTFDIDKNIKINNVVCYGDTDSAYVSFDKVMDKLRIPENKRLEMCRKLSNMTKKKLEDFNEKFSMERFNSPNNIFWEQELIADSALFVKRKRYALHIVEKDGFSTDDLLVKGMEIVRSSVPKKFRGKLKDIVKFILKGASHTEINKFAQDLYKDFLTWSIDDIALPKTANNLVKFNCENLSFISGTPGHIRAAISYNYFREKYGFTDFEPIMERDGFKMVYIKNIPELSVPCVGFKDTPFIMKIGIENNMIQRDKHFELGFISPVNSILESVGYKIPDLKRDIVDDLFE